MNPRRRLHPLLLPFLLYNTLHTLAMPIFAAALWGRNCQTVITLARSLARSSMTTRNSGAFRHAKQRPRNHHIYYFSTTVRGGGGGRGGNETDQEFSRLDETNSPYRVYLAVGSNLGHRFDNIRQALNLLCQDSSSKLVKTSFLHETSPMYVTDQPAFLNGAVELATTLPPLDLLNKLKRIEADLGRSLQNGIRNGPRPVDLDILFYETRVEAGGSWFRRETLHSENLTIPHPRLQERNFVLKPLLEVAGPSLVHPLLNATIGELYDRLLETTDDEQGAVRVLPLPNDRFLYWNETLIMGILNVTPDSFSDGGQFDHVEVAAQRALRMYQEDGAAIIDVGGESTRPGAEDVLVEEELRRTIPVIRRIREISSEVPISIDTRRAAVAKAAVQAGADIVNDVSGGSFDPEMLSTVADLGVPVVLMHMRGAPKTMQTMTRYENVVADVANALSKASQAATDAGIPRWLQIVDPGIGFSKDMQGNLSLLRHLSRIRVATDHLPILIGTSRKGFLGTLANVPQAVDRDYATVASCVTALCLEEPCSSGTILRVHSPAAMVQAIKVMEAIRHETSTRRRSY
eukprot:scaffold1332_cov166-Amphora_coffeaeformis.AAC.10